MRELLRSTTAYKTVGAEAAKGTLSHATLVIFPDGKYLRSLLRECASAFFQNEGERVRELAQREQFSDCLYYPAEGGKWTVGDGASIIDESLLRPIEGGKKLFVLDAFHTASALVQNKLLKILEEPPKGVFFLLGATSDFGILPTVLSRVGKIEEPPFLEEKIMLALNRMHGESERVRRAAAASGGILSAVEALLSEGNEDFPLAEEFLSLKRALPLARKIGERKEKTAFLAAVRLTLRDMLFYKTGQGKYASLSSVGIKNLAREYPVGAIVRGLELVSEAEKQIKFNANYGQCLLSLAMQIAEEKEKWQRLS